MRGSDEALLALLLRSCARTIELCGTWSVLLPTYIRAVVFDGATARLEPRQSTCTRVSPIEFVPETSFESG